MKRLLITLAAAVAIGGLAAAPAQAATGTVTDSAAVTTSDTEAMGEAACGAHLNDLGYDVGPRVEAACKKGTVDPAACSIQLTHLDVEKRHADVACKLASRP